VTVIAVVCRDFCALSFIGHWLDGPERLKYKLGMLLYRMPAESSPRYLTDHCPQVSSVTFRQRLRSASSHQLVVPRYRLSTYGRRAFSDVLELVARRPDLRDIELGADAFRHLTISEDVLFS